jgi:sugar/nucleoside kinase (ribokinase family)
MNFRDTLYTYLNVFETFHPVIPPAYADSKFVFLANIDPALQLEVLGHMNSPVLTVLDTMNFWISGKRSELDEVIRKVDFLILNDEELKELTGMPNLTAAASRLLEEGLKGLVVKKGEHGAILITADDYFSTPAFPVTDVVDPTGAGDSFAGGFVGYLASCRRLTKNSYRRAVAYGSAIASFNVEAFSFDKLKQINLNDIEERLKLFRRMTRF